MKLHLDYAQSAHATPAWVWWALAAALAASALAVWQWSLLRAERDGLAQRLAGGQAAARQAPVRAAFPAEKKSALKQQAAQANAVLAELGRPWPQLFAHLEKSAGSGIALLAIRPEAGRGRVRIVGEARNLEEALGYVRRLSAGGGFSEVVIEQHEVVDSDSQKPVRFALNARWGV